VTTPVAPRDVFFHIRLVGRQWDRDLLQIAFVSGAGEVVVSSFVWSPLTDVQTDRLAHAAVFKVLGPATPSLGFMTPLIEQACKGANLITVNADRQRRLLPARCLSVAAGLRELPPHLASLVRDGPSTGEPLSETIDRFQDAVTITFRVLCLWSGARPETQSWPVHWEHRAGLRECGL